MEVFGNPMEIGNKADIIENGYKVNIIEDGYKIKAKGTYNLEELYEELKNWFEHMGYKWLELEYKQVINRDGSKNLEILWQGEKEIDDYVTFKIKLNMNITGINDTEIKLETGATVKRQKCTLEIKSGAWIEKNVDYFKKKLLGKYLPQLYEILIRDRLIDQKQTLYLEVHKLYDELKAFMMIYR